MESMLVHHVFSETSSELGFMRARVSDIFTYGISFVVTTRDNHALALQNVGKLRVSKDNNLSKYFLF
jgi:hypothetical protein